MEMQDDNFDVNEAFEQLDFQNRGLQQQNMELSGALTGNRFNDQDEENLIRYQLETDKILERIEHFLKGDQIKFGNEGVYYAEPVKKILALEKKDPSNGMRYFIQEKREKKKGSEIIEEFLVKIINKDGEEVDVLEKDSKRILEKIKNMKLNDCGWKYVEIVDEDRKPFNEYGVAELMRIISMYVTKETFLSNYEESRVHEILADLGNELNKFLYCNYEKMGMDTKFKESKYILIVINILHSVESCYRRAIGGEERENLRSRSIVTQNNPGQMRMPVMRKKWHPLKPSTW